MMEISNASSELLRQLVMWLSVGLPGMPPGPTDPQLLHAIPADAVIAVQWSGRGTGEPGAAGLSGALADPEIARAAEAMRALARFTSQLEQDLAPAGSQSEQTNWTNVAETWLQHPGCLYVSVAPPSQRGVKGLVSMLQVGVTINPGDHLEDVRQQLATQMPHWALVDATAPPDIQPHTTGLVQHRQLGTRLAWGFGDTLAGIEQRLAAQQGGLADSPNFQRLLPQVAAEEPGSLVWLQFPAVTGQLMIAFAGLPVDAQEALTQGWRQVGSLRVLSVCGLKGGHVVSRTAVECPGLRIADGSPWHPIPVENLQRIPADAHVVAAVGCDPGFLLNAALNGLAKVLPSRDTTVEDLRSRLQTELGLDLDKDILPAFGTTWTVSSSPSTGGTLGLGPVLSLDVRTPPAAHAAFTQAMICLQGLMPAGEEGHVRLSGELFHDRMLYTLQYRERTDLGLSPCFCITDQELLITLQPQTMRAHLRFLERGGPTFADRAEAAQWPADAVAKMFVDAPRFTEVIWPLLPSAANAPLNRLAEFGLGIDAGVIPSTAAMLQFSLPCTAAITPIETGCVMEVQNPLSLAIPALAGIALPALQQIELPHSDADVPSDSRIEIDLGIPAGETAPGTKLEGQAPRQDPAVKPAAGVEDPAVDSLRRMAPGLIRALTPDDVEMLIPAEVFRRLEQGPTLEQLQKREQRRLEREKRRAAKP